MILKHVSVHRERSSSRLHALPELNVSFPSQFSRSLRIRPGHAMIRVTHHRSGNNSSRKDLQQSSVPTWIGIARPASEPDLEKLFGFMFKSKTILTGRQDASAKS
jgi:hypothetical protein